MMLEPALIESRIVERLELWSQATEGSNQRTFPPALHTLFPEEGHLSLLEPQTLWDDNAIQTVKNKLHY